MFKKVSESLRKIRNTARFILGNLDSGESSDLDSRMKQWSDASIDLDRLSPLNKLMIYRLEAFVAEATSAYEAFNYRKVFDLIQHMISNDLSAFYMDVSKDRLYCDDQKDPKRQQCQEVLIYTLKVLMSIVAPIAPCTCEDIYQFYIIDGKGQGDEFKEHVYEDTGKGAGVYDVESIFQNIRWPDIRERSPA